MAEITLDAIEKLLDKKLEPLQADISAMKEDIKAIKSDVEEVKEHVEAVDFWCKMHDEDIYILKRETGLAK